MCKNISLVFIFVLLAISAEARKKKNSSVFHYVGVVQSCHDGDTCRVQIHQNKVMKVRLSGIDTPELHQKFGLEAKQFTESLIKGKSVSLQCEGHSFDRTTCDIFLGAKHINSEIVRYGWAYDSLKYSKGRYKSLVAAAQVQKLGVWKEGREAMSPYCFRHKSAKACKRNIAYMP